MGIAMHGNAQLVFIDTPGIFEPRRRLDRAMVDAAWSGAADGDRVMLMVDAKRGVDDDTRRIVKGLRRSKRAAILVLNKIDLVPASAGLELARVWELQAPSTAEFAEWMLVLQEARELAQKRGGPPGIGAARTVHLADG